MEGEVLQEVSATKFLGVIIDKELTWNEHITYINSKILKGMGMLIKARNYLNKDGLIALYNSFVFPYFTYCNHIWGSTYKSNLSKSCVLDNDNDNDNEIFFFAMKLHNVHSIYKTTHM